MLTLKIDSNVSENEFSNMASEWGKANDAEIEMPNILSTNDIQHIYNLAMSMIPNEFAYTVLSDLAEFENVSDDLLRKILETKERGCIEAVCLRDNLPDDMRQICNQIAEHTKST